MTNKHAEIITVMKKYNCIATKLLFYPRLDKKR